MALRGKCFALLKATAVLVAIYVMSAIFSTQPVLAAGNSTISFEGKITTSTGTNIPDSSYNMEFKIYTGCTNNTGTGCTNIWTEDWLIGASNPVVFSSGTFQVNLGAICPFSGGTCQGNTNTAIPWDTSPLYMSMEIGNTTSGGTCTAPIGANFVSDCGGDGVMSPYIELTASPYAEDAGLLDGISSSGFGQLANTSTETWSGNTNIFQPNTLNVPSVQILQNKSGSFGQDVFDVQGSSGGTNNFIQVTSTAANQGAVNISALGGTTTGNAVTITGGAATTSTGGAINLTGGVASTTTAGSAGGPISIQAGAGTSFTTGGAGGSIAIASGNAGGNASVAENAGTVSIDTGTSIDGGSGTINVGATNANVINVGNAASSTITTLKGGATLESLSSTSGATIQSTTNSQNAYQVDNSVGAPILQVDTTSTDPTGANVNLLSYPGFEVPNGALPMGWSAVGTGTLTQNTNQQLVYNGTDSAKLASTATGGGVSTSNYIATPVDGTTYYVSFYVEPASGTSITPAGFTATLGGVSCSPTGATVLSTTGFTRLSCSIIPTGAISTLQLTENVAGSSTIYFDAIQLQSNTYNGATISAPTGYQVGGIQLRGIIENPVDIEPESTSTTAFQVQNSVGSNVFSIDNLNSIVQVGSQTTNATVVMLGLDSYNTLTDPASTCTATTDLGALYYNTASNNVRACIGGAWQDLVSTAGLSQLLFGVVPNSGDNPGDLIGASAIATPGTTGGPCKVVWDSTTSVEVQPCMAYSGGREVSVPQTNVALTGIAANTYTNLCLNSSGVPALDGTGNTTDGHQTTNNLTNTNATTLGQPLLCLATVETNGTVGDIGSIYDIRTFTTTTKTYGTISAATPQVLGGLLSTSATAGLVAMNASATGQAIGVLVAATGTAGTAGTPNAMYAISGPQWIKATALTINDYVIGTTTTGYASGAGTALVAYDAWGINLSSNLATSCTTGTFNALTDCQKSLFTQLDIQ